MQSGGIVIDISKRFILLLILLFAISSTASAIDLVKTLEFSIPEITSISEYSFGYFDDDATPEVLVRSDDRLVLYSISGDSLLYDITLPDAYDYKIAFGDVNHDDVTEIIVALSYDVSVLSDSAGAVQFYTVNDTLPFETLYINNYEYYPYSFDDLLGFEPITFECLDAKDLDGDLFVELVISYYVPTRYKSGFQAFEENWGETLIFRQILSDTLIQAEAYLTDPIFLNDGCSKLMLGCQNEKRDEITGMPVHWGFYSTFTRSITVFDLDSLEFGNIREINSTWCSEWGSDKEITSHLDILAIGNMDTDDCGYEALLSYYWKTFCNPDLFNDAYTIENYEWYYVDIVSASEYSIRNVFVPFDAEHFVFHAEYPGTYFALASGSFRQYSVETNAELSALSTVPDNIVGWEYPFDNSTPYLVTNSGSTMALYEISSVTSADDDVLTLPSVFSIGAPRPNPFNASQVIPISASKTGKNLEVSVYDILGKRVAVLFNGVWSTAKDEVVWNAEKFPSGVYFIQARSGNEVHTVKSVLLK